ncbi:MAG: TonB-dependent receptor [Cyclonatronaceae bacterium]
MMMFAQVSASESITMSQAEANETELLIAGQIQDTKGAPMPGATVQVLREGRLLRGFTADSNGFFEERLSVHENTDTITLRISFVGYTAQERELQLEDGREFTNLMIELQQAVLQQNEISLTASPTGSNRSYRPTDAVALNDLQQRAADNFGAALAFQPGVSVRSFGAAASRPVIRGFDGQRVLMLENGERMGDLAETAPDHATAMDTDVAERIEIIRGPASFLYGSGAIGGVVNVLNGDVPTNWQNGLSGRVSATGTSVNEGGSGFGRFTYGGVQTAVSGRLNYRDTGDIHTPDGPLLGTENQNLNAALGLGFQNDGFRGGLSASFLDQDYGLPEAPDDPLENVGIRLDRQQLGGFGQFESSGFFDHSQLRFNLSRYKHQEIETEQEAAEMPPVEELEIEFRTTTLSGSLLMIRENRQDGQRSGAAGSSIMVRGLGLGGKEGLTPDGRNLNTAVFGYIEQPLTGSSAFRPGCAQTTTAWKPTPTKNLISRKIRIGMISP